MAKLTTKRQNELIEIEVNKWNEIFQDQSDERKKAAASLIERVAFMKITLEILEEDIKAKGPTYKFEQGTQKMMVENPSQKSYNTMINRYTAACDKLFGLLPKLEPAEDKGVKRDSSGLI